MGSLKLDGDVGARDHLRGRLRERSVLRTAYPAFSAMVSPLAAERARGDTSHRPMGGDGGLTTGVCGRSRCCAIDAG